MPDSPKKNNPSKWHHPAEVMKLHKLKQKKKALQARINGNVLNKSNKTLNESAFEDVFAAKKRQNPFLKNSEPKRIKSEPNPILEESSDQTLFKLLYENTSTSSLPLTSFNNIFSKINAGEIQQVVKAQGESWLPIDWALKSKVRLLSAKPFPWNQKLKISEEASGITAFTRCLDNNTATTLDTSPNAKFHQVCLYWQQPCIPWLNLFPRSSVKASNSFSVNSTIRDSLQQAWSDSLRSLFQLIRTRQCPYFYACANSFTVLFRAAGICGFTDVHALITPTTRGFRQLLRQADIEFKMPLKMNRSSDQGYETLDSIIGDQVEDEEVVEEAPVESWLKSWGINDDDIKQINCAQEKMVLKSECEVDSSEQSLVIVEGVEVLSLYNFLINCKSATALSGPFAGIPPTLLAPVAFQGASLNSLKVRENKVHLDDVDYYSLELSGPILPSTIHSLFAMNSPEHSVTATFNSIKTTESFSKVKHNEKTSDSGNRGSVVFVKENLSDCGLLPKVLKHFCAPEKHHVTNVECLKYTSDNKTYTWS